MEQQKLTLQQIFDNAWNAFVVRKEGPGYDIERDVCKYRSPNGCKCAIGHSIPDSVYDLFGDRGGALLDYRDMLLDTSFESLGELQGAHDACALRGAPFAERIEPELRSYAAKYNLTIPQ